MSGGWHSTASALLLKDYGFENVILVHNKTYLEMKSSLETIKKLKKITKYPYIEIEPDLKNETIWDVLKRSFQKIPEIREDVKNKKYDRTKIDCCNILKKYPAKKFYKLLKSKNPLFIIKGNSFEFFLGFGYALNEIIKYNKSIEDIFKIKDSDSSFVIISSLCPFEQIYRLRHLKELREKDPFLRLHKKAGKIYFAYPFRDQLSEKPFLPYLHSKGFNKIKHSACVICPLAIVFKNYKSSQYYLSLKAMARAGLPCFQKTIMDFKEI